MAPVYCLGQENLELCLCVRNQIKKNEKGGAYNRFGGQERCIQGFDVET